MLQFRQSAGARASQVEAGEARITDARARLELLRAGGKTFAGVSREPQCGAERDRRDHASRAGAQTAFPLQRSGASASAVQIASSRVERGLLRPNGTRTQARSRSCA